MAQELEQVSAQVDVQEAPVTPLMPTSTSDGAVTMILKQAQAMDAAYQMGRMLSETDMVPQGFKGKPADCAAAIMYGAELGMPPLVALQNVFVVRGRPATYGRTMAALLKAKGYLIVTDVATDRETQVTITAPTGEVETSTWTLERAEKAGYTQNKLYATNPQAMLYAKALSEAARRIAPHVLAGLEYTVEELRLEQPMRHGTPQPRQADSEAVEQARAALDRAADRQEIKAIMQGLDQATMTAVRDHANDRYLALPEDAATAAIAEQEA